MNIQIILRKIYKDVLSETNLLFYMNLASSLPKS